jgi:hypothetical protein
MQTGMTTTKDGTKAEILKVLPAGSNKVPGMEICQTIVGLIYHSDGRILSHIWLEDGRYSLFNPKPEFDLA